MHGFIVHVMLFREYIIEWNWNLMPDSLETHVMIQNIFLKTNVMISCDWSYIFVNAGTLYD